VLGDLFGLFWWGGAYYYTKKFFVFFKRQVRGGGKARVVPKRVREAGCGKSDTSKAGGAGLGRRWRKKKKWKCFVTTI